MKALIIDDERLARQELKALLSNYQEIEILGECNNSQSAIKEITEKLPDVIFLDIQMPGKNGFDMLSELDWSPEVVFVTAYDEYAIKAFEVNALDYLLKPIQQSRLDETVKKLLAKEKEIIQEERNAEILGLSDKVFVKDGEKCWFVELKDIRLFESEGNYVRVYFEGFKPLILKSLSSLELRLDPKVFFRTSRKHIVNLKSVESIENWFNGGLMASIKGGEKIEISRRQAARFKEIMSL